MTELAFTITYWGAICTVAFVVVASLIAKTGIDLLGKEPTDDPETETGGSGTAW